VYCLHAGTRDLEKLAKHWLSQNTSKGLRTKMAYSLSTAMILRSESLQMLCLADLCLTAIETEGRVEAFCMVATLRQGVLCSIFMITGKTNQFSKAEYGGCIRHDNPAICPVGATAFWLFHRYHIQHEDFPDLSSPSLWYNILLFSSNTDNLKACSYNSYLTSINEAFSACSITSRKKTHAGRKGGANIAEMGGVPDNQIERMGRWNNQSMENVYLINLPRDALKVLAGYKINSLSCKPTRELQTPPNDLELLIFPQLEELSDRLIVEENKDIATWNFIGVMKYFRTVILQDAAALHRDYPDHIVLKHRIFQSRSFTQFAQSMTVHEESVIQPEEVQFRNLLPGFLERLSGMFQSQTDSFISQMTTTSSLHSVKVNQRLSFISGTVGSMQSTLKNIGQAIVDGSQNMDVDDSIIKLIDLL